MVRSLADEVLRRGSTEPTPRATDPTLREVLDVAWTRAGGEVADATAS